MNLEQKLQVARALRDLGVDVIEAGFAAASPGDLESIRAVGQLEGAPIVASHSRCNRGDIAASWEALKDAPRRRCHVFLATSPIHRDFKLKMAKDEIVRRAVEGVNMAREKFDDVEFSTEDAARTEFEFLDRVFLPTLRRMGAEATISLIQSGFAPVGGGIIECQIQPCPKLAPIDIHERGELIDMRLRVPTRNLPDSIAERILTAALDQFPCDDAAVEPREPGPGRGV
jgi:hypothetical protein